MITLWCLGFVTATATNPIWLIKTRLQLQSNATTTTTTISGNHYRNSLHCLKTIVQKEGFRALYQGLSASYLGVIEGTLQWVIYERLKRMLHEHRRSRHTSSEMTVTCNKGKGKEEHGGEQ